MSFNQRLCDTASVRGSMPCQTICIACLKSACLYAVTPYMVSDRYRLVCMHASLHMPCCTSRAKAKHYAVSFDVSEKLKGYHSCTLVATHTSHLAVHAGGKESSNSMLTKLVPGQMGLSQHLNSKAACLVIRPAVSRACLLACCHYCTALLLAPMSC